YSCFLYHSALYSFPTRRSSDLSCTTSSTVFPSGSIGANTSHLKGVKGLKGNIPYWTISYEPVIATGTTNALGFFFNKVAIPPTLNFFILPVLVRVPSGKMKADQFFCFMLLASFNISAIDCF